MAAIAGAIVGVLPPRAKPRPALIAVAPSNARSLHEGRAGGAMVSARRKSSGIVHVARHRGSSMARA